MSILVSLTEWERKVQGEEQKSKPLRPKDHVFELDFYFSQLKPILLSENC